MAGSSPFAKTWAGTTLWTRWSAGCSSMEDCPRRARSWSSAGARDTRSSRSRSARAFPCWRRWAHPRASPWRWRASSTRRWSDSFAAIASTSIQERTGWRRAQRLVPDNRFVLSARARRPLVRAAILATDILLVEWTRALAPIASRDAGGVLVIGGLALVLTAALVPFGRLGLGTSRLGLRILGGLPPA